MSDPIDLIDCPCGKRDVPNWDGKGRCITCTRDAILGEVSLCPSCNCMSHTVDGKCGKCKANKLSPTISDEDVKRNAIIDVLQTLFLDGILDGGLGGSMEDCVATAYLAIEELYKPTINAGESSKNIRLAGSDQDSLKVSNPRPLKVVDQDKLIDYVTNPEIIKKAVEGSMEKRQALIDRVDQDKELEQL